MEETHAKFSPSKLPRIILCPGSGLLESTQDQGNSNQYADEGTMLHMVTRECLDVRKYTVPQHLVDKFTLTPEHIEAVEECLDFAFSLAQNFTDYPDAYDMVETRVSLKEFAGPLSCVELEDVEGTLDYALVVPSKRLLHIVDWKFGVGIEVFPDSAQLKAYALGKLKDFATLNTFDDVVLTVVQPRLLSSDDTVKHFHTTANNLLQWLKGDLVPALALVNAKHPTYNPSKIACQWCPIKATCNARRDMMKLIAVDVFAVHGTLPSPDDQEVADLLGKAETITAYLKDLAQYAFHKITAGQEFPGYKVVAGKSSRSWVDEQKARDWLTEIGLQREDLYNEKFVSPAQAEKKINKVWRDKPEFTELFVKKEGNPTLAKETDKRAALTFRNAAEIFIDSF